MTSKHHFLLLLLLVVVLAAIVAADLTTCSCSSSSSSIYFETSSPKKHAVSYSSNTTSTSFDTYPTGISFIDSYPSSPSSGIIYKNTNTTTHQDTTGLRKRYSEGQAALLRLYLLLLVLQMLPWGDWVWRVLRGRGRMLL
ncbi:hypothetical protein K440DRAFT_360191 [Wilcoxina mikolae CBS 423.85]|nr:hypothetical protein K440DRAFT_360191 [Wilcoxina mikolae CBS 423.85]